MSASGAFVLAFLALFVLGAFAAWLLNVPWWAIGGLAVLSALVLRWHFRRSAARRARQKAEA